MNRLKITLSLGALVVWLLTCSLPHAPADAALRFTPLHQFSAILNAPPYSNSDGTGLQSELVLGNDGNFYGATQGGGLNGNGTVFKITPSGTFTTLYTFSSTPPHTFLPPNSDGTGPTSLVLGNDGNFYGTAAGGGVNGSGTIFKITPPGSFSVLHSFSSWSGYSNVDGAAPNGLVLGNDGNFYGTTAQGGAGGENGGGTVFELTPTGILTTLHNFRDGTVSNDGSYPNGGLVEGNDGNFYGSTSSGGTSNQGAIFKITPAGSLTILVTFTFTGPNGAQPRAGLILGNNGNFYGTTSLGGTTGGSTNGSGTIFMVTPTGTLTTLYSFSAQSTTSPFGNSDGIAPRAPLIQGSDGNFYGTTTQGGLVDNGTVFKITPTGILTTLYTFSADDSGGINSDGYDPNVGLAQGTGGNFYGATLSGGTSGAGTIFEITPDSIPLPSVTLTPGAVTQTSEAFSATAFSSDGAPLTYTWSVFPAETPGFTEAETGTVASGTAFGNTLSVSRNNSPSISLTVTDDYGQVASAGASVSIPVVPTTISISPASLAISIGATQMLSPTVTDQFGALISPPSVIWGVVAGGGYLSAAEFGSPGSENYTAPSTSGTATIKALSGSVAATVGITIYAVPAITSIVPASGVVGSVVTITGMYFAHVTSVTFTGNGLGSGAASFHLDSPTQITATVPASATSGTVGLTTPAGTAYSSASFTVTAPPRIYGFTPYSGPAGTPVSITGENFTGTTVVGFQGQHATSFTVVDGGTITATVPAGAVSGPIADLTPAGEAKSGTSFTVTTATQKPTITGFTPASGVAGTVVTITGTNLTGATVVGFQNAHANSFTVNGAGTQITTTVPNGASTGPIAVLTPGGEAKSATSFTIIAPPTITGFMPFSGPVGTTVAITGTNLTGATVVGFQGQHAKAFTVNGAGTQITTTVPAGAATGAIAVATPDGTAKSTANFTAMP